MKKLMIYALVAFMTTFSLFGMEAEMSALAKAAGKAAETTKAEAERLALERSLRNRDYTQFTDDLIRERTTPQTDFPSESARSTALNWRARLQSPIFRHYAPQVADVLANKFKIPLAQAVALLGVPAATESFLEALPHNPVLREETKQWAIQELQKWSNSAAQEQSEKDFLWPLLHGTKTSEGLIPPLLNAAEINALALKLPLFDAIDHSRVGLIKLLLGAKLDPNFSYTTTNMEIGRLSLLQYVLLRARKDPTLSTAEFVRLLSEAGATLSDKTAGDNYILMSFIERAKPDDNDNDLYLSALQELLLQNKKGKNIQFTLEPFIKAFREKRYPSNLDLEIVKLLQQYAPPAAKGIWPWSK